MKSLSPTPRLQADGMQPGSRMLHISFSDLLPRFSNTPRLLFLLLTISWWPVLTPLSAQQVSAKVNLMQWSNGKLSGPGQDPAGISWKNGNLNGNNAHIAEGMTVPYRLEINYDGVGSGVDAPATRVLLEYNLSRNGSIAWDFPTSYDRAGTHDVAFGEDHTAADFEAIVMPAEILKGTALESATPPSATFPAPQPAYLNYLPGQILTVNGMTGDAIAENHNPFDPAGQFMIYNGSIQDIRYVDDNGDPSDNIQYTDIWPSETDQINGANGQDAAVQMEIVFTPDPGAEDVVILWGMHLAMQYQFPMNGLQAWGEGATAIDETQGSPYQVQVIACDDIVNGCGSTPMNIQAGSVVNPPLCENPPTIMVPLNPIQACEGLTAFNVDVTTTNPGGFTGDPQYFLMPFGENNPISPMTDWANLIEEENGQQSFEMDFTGVGVGTYDFQVKLRYSDQTDCESVPTVFSVTIAPDPTVSVSTLNPVACVGGSIRLMSDPSESDCSLQWQEWVDNTWQDLDGETGMMLDVGKFVAGGYLYRVVATGCQAPALNCEAVSDPVEITFQPDPTIEVSMLGAIPCASGAGQLQATVSGAIDNCDLIWEELIDDAWRPIDGASETTVSITKEQAGTYRFRARLLVCDGADGCEVRSPLIELPFSADPTVTIARTGATPCAGGSTELTATTDSDKTPCALRWQEQIDGVWTDIPNAAEPTLAINKPDPGAYFFRAVVESCAGGDGCDGASEPFEVVFAADPTLEIQGPAEVTCAGGTATLQALVTNGKENCQFQWQQFLNDAWINLPGENAALLQTQNPIAGLYTYRVRVTVCEQGDGCEATSEAFELNVREDPTVNLDAMTTTACVGGALRVTASINNPNGACGLQWQEWNQDAWTDLEGQTSSFLTVVRNTQGQYRFRARIVDCDGGPGCDAASDDVTLTFIEGPTVTLTAAETTACAGGALRLEATPGNTQGLCSYIWEERIGEDWVTVTGAETNTLTVAKDQAGSYSFRVRVRRCNNTAGCDATSAPLQLTFTPDPVPQINANRSTACAGGTLVLEADMNEGQTCSFQWQEQIGDNWENLPGETSASLSVSKTAAGDYSFRLLADNCDSEQGCDGASAPIAVTFTEDPTATVSANTDGVCAGGTIELTADYSGDYPGCVFIWQALSGDQWFDLPNETESTLLVSRSEAGVYSYRVQITSCVGSSGCDAISAPIDVTFVNDPQVQIEALRTNACTGGSLRLIASTQSSFESCIFTWQELVEDTWLDMPDQNTSMLTVTRETPGTYRYRARVSECNSDGGCDATSDPIDLSFVADPNITIAAQKTQTCAGGVIPFAAQISDYDGACNLQWQEWKDEQWTDIENATGANLNLIKDTPGAFRIRAVVTDCEANGGCQAASEPLEVLFAEDPAVFIRTESNVSCVDGNVRLEAVLEEANGSCSIQWQELVNDVWIDLPGADRNVLFVSKAEAGTYNLRVTLSNCDADEGCGSTSDAFPVVFHPDPRVRIDAADKTACAGGTLTLSAIVTGGQGVCNLQWEELVGNEWRPLPGATGQTLEVTKNTVGEYFYQVRVIRCEGGNDCGAVAQAVQVNFEADPSVSVSSPNNDACAGGAVQLAANVADGHGACTFQWQAFEAGEWVDLPDKTASTLSVHKGTAGAYTYRVWVTGCQGNDGCDAVSDAFEVRFTEDPIVRITGSTMACTGGVLPLTAVVENGHGICDLQWQEFTDGAWKDLTGATGETLEVSKSNEGVYTYRVQVTGCSEAGGCNARATPYTVTFADQPTVRLQPSQTTVCSGDGASYTATIEGGSACTQIKYFIRRMETEENFREVTTKDSGLPLLLPLDLDNDYVLTPATYIIRAETLCGVSSCAGFDEATLIVREEPSIPDDIAAEVCAKDETGIVLTVENPDAQDVLEISYWVTAIDAGGLEPESGDPYSALGVASNDQVIADDAWRNTGDAPVDVVYTVMPRFQYGTDEFCDGAPQNIIVTVRPQPELSATRGSYVCSESPLGVPLTLETPPADDIAEVFFIINDIDNGGLTAAAGAPLADPNAFHDAGEIADDAWRNEGTSPIDVVYRIRPVFQYGVEDYCYGEEQAISFTILPAPQMNPVAPLTLCSPGNPLTERQIGTGIVLSIDNDPETPGDQAPATGAPAQPRALFRLDVMEGVEGLTAGLSNAQPGEIGDQNLISGDTWTNEGENPVEITYRITPLLIYYPETDRERICYGPSRQIPVTVLPNPSVDIQLAITGFDYPSSGVCDNFDMLLDVEVCNSGPVDIRDLTVDIDLAGLTNGIVTGLTANPARVDGENLDAFLNPAFDGQSDPALFSPGGVAIPAGACARYRLRMEIAPPNATTEPEISGAIFQASAVARGDWSDLPQTNAGFDETQACYALTGRSEIALGDCWQRSRNAGSNDLVNVTLDENCQALITPDMLLEGYKTDCGAGAYPAGGFYRLIVIKPDGSEEGPFTSVVLNAGDFDDGRAIIEIENVGKACLPWDTELLLEDKTEPEFGEYDTLVTDIILERPAQRISGALSREDGQINLSAPICFNEEPLLPDCFNDYQTIAFEVDQADFFNIELAIDGAQGMLALYEGAFDPQEPCARIIAQNAQPLANETEPGDPAGRIRLVLPLEASQTYTLLVSSTDCDGEADDFEVYFSGANGGSLLEASAPFSTEQIPLYYPLLCTDIDTLLNRPASTTLIPGPPVLSDCTPNTKWFEDELVQNGDCGLPEIRRTWYVRDEENREGTPVVQTLRFSRPGIRDVYQPAASVAIECNELVADILDENGNPLPSVTGYPFLVSAFGIHPMEQAVCNIGATYEDISDITVCADTRMVVREWIFTDWCDGDGTVLSDYRQVLNLGDFTAPQVVAPDDVVLSTTPFGCSGVLTIANPTTSDNCSATINILARVLRKRQEAILDRFGRETGEFREVLDLLYTGTPGDEVTGLEMGFTYLVEYEVSDACGNTAAPVSYEVTVEDDVSPSVICNRELAIVVGGDGLGRIHARDVDEGSWDNCQLESTLISRALSDEALRDAYLEQIYNLNFNQLVDDGLSDTIDPTARQWVLPSDPVQVILRQKDGVWHTAWLEEQWFLCEDIGVNVGIELAAIDASGNANVCGLSVTVEDKTAPYCVAPANVTLTCTELPPGFDPEDDAGLATLFGDADATDNCSATATQTGKNINWDCNSGTITRFFQATDQEGLTSLNTCKQVVTVTPVHHYEIRFPADARAECGRPAADTIETTEIACDLLSVSVTDEDFVGSENACFTTRRTYKVINWCEYDGESNPVVVSRNPDCDAASGEEDVFVLVRPNGIVYIDRDNDENNAPALSPCGNGAEGHLENSTLSPALASTGYWQYTQILEVFDQTAPVITHAGDDEFCSLSDDCAGPATFPISVTDECAGSDIHIQVLLRPDPAAGLETEIDLQQTDNAALYHFQLSGAYPDYTLSGRFPIGAHQLVVIARDGCGNSSLETIDFRIADCKPPAPVCINGLVIELMPTEPGVDADGDGDEDAGAMAISASDFRISGLSECSEPVTLSINRMGDSPDRNQGSIMLTCDDLDTVFVEIYAWDNADNPVAVQPDGTIGGPNYDHCETYVIVQDNLFSLCSTGASVSGLIATREDIPVENVEVELSGQMVSSMLTAADGTYTFDNLTPGGDYTVSPLRDDDHRNGVSTFDLILITKHLLRTRPLTDPYQIVAADVNRSNSVSALDIIHLRKLLLTVYPQFPRSESWRFVPANYAFPDPARPFAATLPEVLNFNDVQTEITSGDFVGVKVGDVNGTATPNSQMSISREISGRFTLQAEEEAMEAGHTYRVPIHSTEIPHIQGFQFTLNFDPAAMELVDMEYGLAGEEAFGWRYADEGGITTSWVKDLADPAANFEPDRPLFTLVFRARQTAKLSELLHIDSRYTEAEAYSEADALLDVRLAFSNENGQPAMDEPGPTLYQNAPNPWTNRTQIRFYLPEAQEATITVRDIQGRTLTLIRGTFPTGTHQIEIDRADLPQSGVLFYTLETGDFTATRRMVLVE